MQSMATSITAQSENQKHNGVHATQRRQQGGTLTQALRFRACALRAGPFRSAFGGIGPWLQHYTVHARKNRGKLCGSGQNRRMRNEVKCVTQIRGDVCRPCGCHGAVFDEILSGMRVKMTCTRCEWCENGVEKRWEAYTGFKEARRCHPSNHALCGTQKPDLTVMHTSNSHKNGAITCSGVRAIERCDLPQLPTHSSLSIMTTGAERACFEAPAAAPELFRDDFMVLQCV